MLISIPFCQEELPGAVRSAKKATPWAAARCILEHARFGG